ncbi:MAG: glycosyltransferase family 39 protein [Chloroflexi bacterium]|nr:glycosyltransferase family 39 protein [Chloroflexota bacterium]
MRARAPRARLPGRARRHGSGALIANPAVPLRPRRERLGEGSPVPRRRSLRIAGLAQQHWLYWAGLGLVLAAAAFLRFYRIDALPLGFHYDEGLDAVSAHEIWSKGVRPIFFPQSGSREPLMIYLESFGILALGATRVGARIAQAFVGTGTVVAAWFLFGAMFNRRVALLGTAFMGLSLWHMFESRLGLRAISQPLVEAIALLFLWRWLERRRWADALLAGAFLGLAQYTYTAARALPLLAVLVVLWQALFSPAFVRRQWAHTLGVAGAALAVFAPLGWYAIHHWQEFFGRSLQVNLIAPEQFTGTDQAGGVGAAIWRTLGMFSVHGDSAWKYNVAGLPVFDWPVSALFYGGIVLAIAGVVRWLRVPRKIRPAASPHLLALLATAVMLTPGFLSAEAPHFLRTIGVMPLLFVFPALGLSWLLDRLGRWPALAASLAALLLAFEGAQTGYRYFVQWASAPDAYYAMHGEAADLASWLEANAGDTPVLFSSEYPGHPTLLYLAPDVFSQIRWFDGRQSLAFPPAGDDTLYVFTAHYLPPFADVSTLFRPDQLVAQGRDPSGAVAWSVYRSSTPPALTPPHALAADLGGLAGLDGFAAPASSAAGQTLDVQEYWHALGPGTPDVRAFLHLVDAQGHVWAQADNLGFYAEDWHPGDAAVNDQRLAVPPWAPPIPMKLQFGLYQADSGRQLPVHVNGAAAGTELTLGIVQV